MVEYDSTYDDSIQLVQKVTRAFYWTAEKLDDNREKIRNARIACGVAVGVGVGASVVAAAATGGLSVLLGGAAISGIALAIFMALTSIANDILDHKDIRGLESQWKALKVDFLRDKNIPQENRADLERWARQNLSDKEKKAVLEALDKSITESSRSTKRLEKMRDDDTQTLLESLLFLVLADFSAFEILVGAMRRKNERPGAAIRRIALQMDGYRDDLLEAKARRLERRRLMEVSMLRLKQEEEELAKSLHEQLLCHDNRPDQEEQNLLTPVEEDEDDKEEEEREEGEEYDEGREPLPVLPRTQKQKRMEKEKQWRKSVEESQLQAHLDEEMEQERRLIEIEQRQRRLAKREQWERCMAEERERKMREAEQQKQAWRQAEQNLMDKEEEEQTQRLLSQQMEDIQKSPNQEERKEESGNGQEEKSVFHIL